MRITRFGGIDRRGPSSLQKGICSAHTLENLRIQSDGTLRGRCGFAQVLSLPAEVRAVWSGSFAGEESVFAAAADKLYRLDLTGGSYTEIGSITAGEGKVALFLWRGKLLCLDGVQISIYDGQTLTAVSPYVPLIANKRAAYAMTEIYEPINLIGREARFCFRGDGENFLFYFGYAVDSIRDVYNVTQGRYYFTSDYTLSPDNYGNSILKMTSKPVDGTIFVARVILNQKYLDYSCIAACADAAVWGDSCADRIVCWNGTQASDVYCSKPVTDVQIREATSSGQVCGDLYFPEDGHFCVGDGSRPVRAACRHYDRLLLFTNGDTWMTDFTDDPSGSFAMKPINSGVGCTAPGAAALAGNDPLTVADGEIWRWSANALRRDECSAVPIAGGIAPIFSAEFSERAFAHTCRRRNEVWFADPSDAAGRVYVYHTEFDAWYMFCGIFSDGFFPWQGDVGFWLGNRFYCFDEALAWDWDDDGEYPIGVQLVLDGLDFAADTQPLHLTRLALDLDGEHPAFALTLATDRGRTRRIEFAAGGEPGACVRFDRPVQSGRFRALRLTLAADDAPRLHLRGLCMTAEPGSRK